MGNELLPGTILYEHYKIIECISTAKFSNVYIVEDTKDNNKQLIIKELLNEAIDAKDREQALKKFEEEVAIYKKLEHENI
jgi:hypothetical protein